MMMDESKTGVAMKQPAGRKVGWSRVAEILATAWGCLCTRPGCCGGMATEMIKGRRPFDVRERGGRNA